MEAIYIAIMFLVLIEIDAIGDAFRKSNTKWQKTFSWLSEDIMLLILLVPYAIVISVFNATSLQVFIYFLGYLLMRGALFNLTYNKARRSIGHFPFPWWYYGREKWTDKLLGWLIERSPFAKWFRPREASVVLILSIFMFIFSLFSIGVWELFPQ